MRFAVISDIHANLPALEEVLKALQRQKVDTIYCPGDVVNQHVWNNEVIELLNEKKIIVIQGNHDEGIGAGKKRFSFSFSSRETEKLNYLNNSYENIRYIISKIETENMKRFSI